MKLVQIGKKSHVNSELGVGSGGQEDFYYVFHSKFFRYFEAIGKQSLACPKMCLRRQMIDTIQSPSPCAIMSSIPLHPSDIPQKGVFLIASYIV